MALTRRADDGTSATATIAAVDRCQRGARQGRGRAIQAIEKQFGTGSIMKLGAHSITAIDVIPTGSIALDLALGVGGIPRGRITEIFGPESSGKTTICQHVIAEAQRRAAWPRSSTSSTPSIPAYARACGVNVDELLVSQPDTGEQALEITETLIRSAASTASSSTPSRRSCRARRSRARWATASSASRPG
jgi:recombination protein RecA